MVLEKLAEEVVALPELLDIEEDSFESRVVGVGPVDGLARGGDWLEVAEFVNLGVCGDVGVGHLVG